ncbi:MAG: leader peptidase (prepilin peptidase) / N-methyltransferase [Pseudomonadota bacterium]|nr:leader peptidase (prepilin peptidase) / N-methyltransferase [Pseudomonadota bacterium]
MYDLFAFVFQNSFLLRGTILFVFGTIIGSFLNVVVYRLPIMLKHKWYNDCVLLLGDNSCPLVEDNLNLIHPGSHCPKCKAKVPFWANIPIIGYFLLNGKCFNCKLKISVRYPLVELFTAILFVITGYLTNDTLILPALLVFISFIICLVLIDYDSLILPDELTLLLLWLGIISNLKGAIAGSLENSIEGAVLGYVSLWCIFWLFKLITKRDGMGYGDFKFLAAVLAWVGYRGFIPITLVSSLLGIIYFVSLRVFTVIKLRAGSSVSDSVDSNQAQLPGLLNHQIPFGPFLGIAAIVFVFADRYFINLPW